jgi:hypothetical protein
MGKQNAQLIRAAEKAKKTFGAVSSEYFAAEAKVEESQARCAHTSVRQAVATRTTKRVKAGDRLKWCLDCALPLEINGRAWAEVHPRKKPN